MNLKKKKIPKKRVFVDAGKANAFGSFWRPGARRRTQAWRSERRHAVEVEVGPLGTAGALVLVPVGAVAVLVHALRGFVRIIVANLFVLLLLFNAGEMMRRSRTSTFTLVKKTKPSLFKTALAALTGPVGGTVLHCCHFGTRIR